MTQFQVHKKDLNKTRLIEINNDTELNPGQVRVKVEAFSFTANNISYWATGDKLNYWQFFPAVDSENNEFGIIPVWGFAEVVESKVDAVPVGERLFGYFPTAETWVMQPVHIKDHLLIDGSEHRQSLAAGYNMYRRVAAEPGYDRANDAMRMLLFPLHITSFCLYDMLSSQDWLGAEQIIIISASSKTSLGLAYALKEDSTSPHVVGITSDRNKAFVEQTGYYQDILAYEDLLQIDATKKTVIVDMSGNGKIIGQVHKHLADNMLFSSHVGLTHYDAAGMGDDFIKARSKMFFAPSHIQQRLQDWGQQEFDKRAGQFMTNAAIDSGRWLTLKEVKGLNGLNEQLKDISQGKMPANEGLIVKL